MLNLHDSQLLYVMIVCYVTLLIFAISRRSSIYEMFACFDKHCECVELVCFLKAIYFHLMRYFFTQNWTLSSLYDFLFYDQSFFWSSLYDLNISRIWNFYVYFCLFVFLLVYDKKIVNIFRESCKRKHDESFNQFIESLSIILL